MEEKVKSDAAILRQKAENTLRSKPLKSGLPLSEVETLRLIHELEVYQVELELQNEELRLAKEEADAASQKYTELYDFAPSGYFTLSKEGKIKELNFRGAHKLGNERRNLINCSFELFVSKETKPIFSQFLQRIFSNSTQESCEVVLSLKDESSIYVLLTGIVTQDGDQCVINAIDISERKHAEDALRKSEAKNYELILQIAMVGYWLLDMHGRFLEVNDTYCRMSGYNMAELLTMRISDLETDEADGFERQIKKVILAGETRFETHHWGKDGRVLNVEINIQYRPINEGQFVAFVHDITDRKLVEKALFESNEQFRLLFENSPDAILFTNPDGTISMANPGAERMLGRSKEEIISLGRDGISNLNDPRLNPALEERRKTGYFKGELTYLRKDGTIFPVDVTSTLFKDSKGVERSSIIAHDITERKQTEIILVQSEQRSRTLFNSMIEGFCIIEMIFDQNNRAIDYRILETNVAYEDHTGLSDVEGKLMRTIAPETVDSWFELYGEIALTGEMMRFEKEAKALNRWFDICAFRMGGQGSLKVAVCFNNITERKQADEILHINNLRLNLAMQAGNMAWWEMDITTGNVKFEKRKTEMLGYASEGFTNYRDFMALVHPEDSDRCLNAMRDHYQGLTDKYQVDYRILAQSGDYIWCSDIGSITTRDANGKPISITGLAFNITERKRAEVEIMTNDARLTLAMKVSNMAWWEMNIVTGAISFEKRKAEMLDYLPENFKHYNDFMKLVHPEDSERAMEAMRKHIYGSADKYEVEYRILAKTGEYKWFYDIGSITKRDTNGKAILATGLVTNITARKEAEQKIKESEDRRHAILQTAMDGYCLLDLQGRLLEVNDTYCRMSGYSNQELLSLSILDLETPSTGAGMAELLQDIAGLGEIRFETCHRRKDGSIFDIDMSVQFQPGEGGKLVVFMHDITNRKQAENALLQSEEKVRLKLQSILSPEGTIAGLELNDIIDASSIQSLMDNFFELTHVPMSIIDSGGKVLVSVGWQKICTKFHRKNPESCKNCNESDFSLSHGINEGEFKLYRCKNHMWDIATPIIIGGEYKGNLSMCQFFFESEPLDYQLYREQAALYGFPEQEYMDALEKVPRLSQKKLDHAKAFLLNFSRTISQLSYSNIKLARAITEQKQSEEALYQYIDAQEKLSIASTLLLGTMTISELNHFAVEQIRQMAGNSIVIMNEYNPETQETIIRAASGSGNKLPTLEAILDQKLIGIDFQVVNDLWQPLDTSGFTPIEGGLHNRSFIPLPEEICHQIEQELEIKALYVMPLMVADELMGTTAIGVENINGLHNQSLIESFIKQVALSLKTKRIEEWLKESEKKYRELVNYAPTPICEFDYETQKLVTVNDAMIQLSGYSREELLSMEVIDLLDEKSKPKFLIRQYGLLNDETRAEQVEFKARKKNGTLIHVVLKIKFKIDEHGKPIGATIILHDITERIKMEEALRESEYFFRESQQAASIGSFKSNFKTGLWDSSEVLYQIFGIDKSYKRSNKEWLKLVHPFDRQMLYQHIREEVIIKGNPFNKEFRIIRKDNGTMRWVHGLGKVGSEGNNKAKILVGTLQDITERKKKLEKLGKLNKALAALSKSSQAMSQAVDEASYLKQVCQIVVEDIGFAMVLIGFTEEDEAKTIRPVESAGLKEDYLQSIKISWDDSELGQGPTGKAIRTGQISICNNMLTDPDFEPWREQALKQGFASSIVFPLKTGVKTFGVLNIYSKLPNSFSYDEIELLSELANDLSHGITTLRLRDAHQLAQEALSTSHSKLELLVSERTSELQITNALLKKEINIGKQQGQSLKEAEQKYRTVADHTHGWEFWLDKDDHFLYCSPSCERITGYNASVFLENPGLLYDIIHPHDRKSFLHHQKTENLSQVQDHELEYRIVRPDGSIRWIGHECQPIRDESGNFLGIRGSNKDITRKKEIEQLLKTSSRKYRLLSANITDGIFICKNGCLEYVNKAMRRIFGFTHYKMEGLMFIQFALSEYHKELNHIFNINTSVNQVRNIEIECFKKNHLVINIEILFHYVAKEKVIYGVVHDITEKKQIQTNIVKAIILTEEKERAYFSKELHDGLGPLLSTIKLYLQWSQRPKNNKSREEIILLAEGILEEALTTVKEISNKLSPHLLTNHGLSSAIQSFVDKLGETDLLKIDFQSNLSRRLNNEIEAAFYRAVIECFNNTIKHAKATTIYIRLNDTGNQLQLEYRDDGIGFDLEETHKLKKGLGLYNLQNRIETIGGKITMISSPGRGLNYKIIVNL